MKERTTYEIGEYLGLTHQMISVYCRKIRSKVREYLDKSEVA
ncbi:hypothetical protein BAOM_2937 [Peribacillus asahii]|uniref:RNA polymerase sigma-70 region 4 domain-containing protein n=1 Tax=Peribacillus asahii TaxID=228899 RepID=A0A3Q9RP09_9BACI|nr:hypothetical protein BAOM_2937 [Peribacillus asahii]